MVIAKGGWDGEWLEVLRHLLEIFSDTSGHAFKYSALNVNFAIDPWVGVISPILQMQKLRFKGVKHLKLVRSGWHVFFLLCPPFFSFSKLFYLGPRRARVCWSMQMFLSFLFTSLVCLSFPQKRSLILTRQYLSNDFVCYAASALK